MVKGEVCKTFMRRFESDRRLKKDLFYAEVVELVDTRDLKSLGRLDRAGSSPALGTKNIKALRVLEEFSQSLFFV